MLNKVIKILVSFNYKIGYSSYHTDSQLKKFKSQEKNLSSEKFFTIYTSSGLVVGRLHGLKKEGNFSQLHLEEIKNFFSIYEIPQHRKVKEKLEKL